MEFRIRKNGRYLDVSVCDGQTLIDLGLLDDKERESLSAILREAASELLNGLPQATSEPTT